MTDLEQAVVRYLSVLDRLSAAGHYEQKLVHDLPPHMHRSRLQAELENAEMVVRALVSRPEGGAA
jgi:hypothetical protein